MRRVGQALTHFFTMALALCLLSGPARGETSSLGDFADIVRIPLDGVSPSASVSVNYSVERAEAVVSISGRVEADLLTQTRTAARLRAASLVSAVLEENGTSSTTLRFLVTRPAMEARVVASARRKGWFLELYVFRSLTKLPKTLALPVVPYTSQFDAPAAGNARVATAQDKDAWLVLADAERSLATGDFDQAQLSLDALGGAPHAIVQWAALRQADLHMAKGEFARARSVLHNLNQGRRSFAIAMLSLLRAAEMTRSLGEDVCPGLVVDQVLHSAGLSPVVKAEVMARRARGLYLEGRFGEALEAYSVLRRLSSTHPLLETLRPAMATARFRSALTAMKHGRPIEALTVTAMLPPTKLADPIDRGTARLQAEAARSLGLHETEVDVRLRLLLQTIDNREAGEQLAALAESYAAVGNHERAWRSMRFLEEQYGKAVAPELLREVRTKIHLSKGHFGKALSGLLAGFTDGLTNTKQAFDRLVVVRLAIEEKGIRGVLDHLAAFSRGRLVADAVAALPSRELSGLYDEARALTGRCHELLIELASGEGFDVLADPERALRLARCSMAAGGAQEAASMFEALCEGKSLLARMARAELAHARWIHGKGRDIATFLSDRTADAPKPTARKKDTEGTAPQPPTTPVAKPAQEIEG